MKTALSPEYVIVRCHAMSTELLSREELLEIAKARDEADFRDRMLATPYRLVMEELPPDARAIDYEGAIYTLLMNRVERVIKVAPEDFKAYLRVYFPLKFEIFNLKRILRGKHAGRDIAEIRDSLLPLSPLEISDYKSLLEAEDVEGVVEALRGTIYTPLYERLELYREHYALWVLEAELLHIFAEELERAAESSPRRFRELLRSITSIRVGVDALLLAVSVSTVGCEYLDPDVVKPILEHVVEVPPEVVEVIMERGEIGEALGLLKHPIDEVMEPILEGDAAAVRRRQEERLMTLVEEAVKMRYFDFPYILWFLMRCEAEARDLVRIAWGIDQKLPYELFSRHLLLI